MSSQNLATPELLMLATAVSVVAVATLLWRALFWSSTSKLPYPPGPPPKNLLSGNLADIPATKPWITYTQWANTYGDIIHLRIFSQHTIILNSIEVVHDLIERRSHIYSDRPEFAMIRLMEWDFNAGLKPLGPSWRLHRRLFDQAFKPSQSLSFRPVQSRKINDLLYGLLTTPEDLKSHYRTVAAAIIMSAVYGYDIKPKGDYFVDLAEAAVAKLSESIFPGASAVNALPVLRYLPAWFPGAGFKRFAHETKLLTRQMRDVPFEFVQKSIEKGSSTPCVVSELLEDSEELPSVERLEAIKEVAATAYAAGSDTTVSALGTFFYAMAMHPQVQSKAQQEIDAVIGTNRLVTFEDRESLPYVEAIFREILRWRPATPLGVARCALEDDVYNNYYIPKGALVLINIWALCHDPRKYKNPEAFNPDRYLDSNGKLLAGDDIYGFGFGRRICSGKHMASETVWLTIASVLSNFNIAKKKDALGNEIPLDGQYTDTLVSHPLPYQCSIEPRSQEKAQLILEEVGKATDF